MHAFIQIVIYILIKSESQALTNKIIQKNMPDINSLLTLISLKEILKKQLSGFRK